jgi:hypothetical protein
VALKTMPTTNGRIAAADRGRGRPDHDDTHRGPAMSVRTLAMPLLAALAVGVSAHPAPALASRSGPVPVAACVDRSGPVPVAVFDARSPGGRAVPVPARNRVTGGRLVGRLPSLLPAGLDVAAVRARFQGRTVTWRLGRHTARLGRTGPRCGLPRSRRRPSISGVARAGGTLTAAAGAWSGATRRYRFAWQRRTGRRWTRVRGARTASLAVRDAHVGSVLRVLVTARGRGGWSPRVASAATPRVRPRIRPAAPASTGAAASVAPSRRIFAPTSFWNTVLPPNVALAGDSVQVASAADGSPVTQPVNPAAGHELAAAAVRPNGSSNTWINYRDYTAPITRVPASTKLQPVRLCRAYPKDCVPSWGSSLDLMMRGVARDGTYLGGGIPVPDGFTPPSDGDAEAIFYQPDYVAPDGTPGRVYELYGMQANPDFNAAKPVSPTNARWMARWGGRLVGTEGVGTGVWRDCSWKGCGYQADTKADPDAWGRPDSQAQDHNWGATATSLSLLGTQVSLDECRQGAISHAIGLEVPHAHSGYWWPARRGDGGSSSAVLTEGMRLAFPAGSAKPAGLTAVGSALWDAASRFGLVIDDQTSSSLNIRVEPGCEQTSWWGGVGAGDQLRNFPWADLRVIGRGSDDAATPLQ